MDLWEVEVGIIGCNFACLILVCVSVWRGKGGGSGGRTHSGSDATVTQKNPVTKEWARIYSKCHTSLHLFLPVHSSSSTSSTSHRKSLQQSLSHLYLARHIPFAISLPRRHLLFWQGRTYLVHFPQKQLYILLCDLPDTTRFPTASLSSLLLRAAIFHRTTPSSSWDSESVVEGAKKEGSPLLFLTCSFA